MSVPAPAARVGSQSKVHRGRDADETARADERGPFPRRESSSHRPWSNGARRLLIPGAVGVSSAPFGVSSVWTSGQWGQIERLVRWSSDARTVTLKERGM